MERSIQLLVAGGIALVAGLWVLHLVPTATAGWSVGAALALSGALAIAVGIASDLTASPFDAI